MKSKVMLLLSIFLFPLMALAVLSADKEDEVVLTPHSTVSLLPAPNIIHPQVPLSTFDPKAMPGSIAYGNDLQHANMYSFNIDDPSLINVVGTTGFVAVCGDFSPGDNEHIWIIDNNDQFLKRINLSTLLASENVSVPCPMPDGIWSCLPINKTTGQFFGIATNGIGSEVYEINPLSGDVLAVLPLAINAAISASFDMSGNLYVFDIDTDQIFVVDIANGTYAPLGLAGFDGNYAQGMGLDPATDKVYLAAYEDFVGPQLRLLDKFTGACTLIAPLPGETGAFGFTDQAQSAFINPGIDQWMVAQASIIFGGRGDMPPIPADFFGPGSEPFQGEIDFVGTNSAGAQEPGSDFEMVRLDGADLTGLEFTEVMIEPQELKLRSLGPGEFGVDSFFDVFVEISIPKNRGGADIIHLENEYGGSFTSDVFFYPVFTFIEVGNPANVLVFEPDASLYYYCPEPYPWTLNPIPGDFDPIGDQPMTLLSEMGGSIELIPYLAREDFAFLMMGEEGTAIEWGGTGYNWGEWYEYPNYGWWNVWFYDHPVDVTRTKIITMTFEILTMNGDMPTDVIIVYNYSTPNWPGWPEMPRPPLPEDVPTIEIEDEMIGRTETIFEFQGVIGNREIITNEFVIEDFNPEWLSIDVMGSNFILDAHIQHVCFKTPPVIELKDFGDAPDGGGAALYPTLLANDGARHIIVPGVHLGPVIDAEIDGQPDFAAVGDDNNPNPKDEDGVQVLSSIVPGQTTNIKVNASVNGYLNAWLDFDMDFDWTGEQIFIDKQLFAGDNYISFAVPASANTGTTYARFRFTTYQGVPFKGEEDNGEVEDYLVEIVPPLDKSKMHFVQWPDLTTNGVDVNCMNEIVVADDFMCTQSGKITDIHLWASWLQDNIPEIPPSFKLGIWSDNPMGQNGHSEPDSLICEYYFNPADYTWEDYANVPDGEWFYDPRDAHGTFPGDWTVFKYNFYIPEGMACHQDSGNIYWLSVNAISDLADYQFGWKTSMFHFNDFATWQPHPINPPWNMLCYPLNHPLENECADMAFYISGPADTILSHNIYIKDCNADAGVVPSIPPCGSLCQGPDIWVDNNSDGFMDNPVVGISNRLYIRARNNGPGTASPVTSSLYFRNCATGLTFPTGASYIGSVTGLSIPAGGTGIGWVPWTVPAPPATYGHWCLGGLVSSPTDPYTPDVPSQMDDNTCFVNIQVLYSRAGQPVPPKDAVAEPAIVEFYFSNPFAEEGNFTLDAEITLPSGWILEFFMDGIQIDLAYTTLLLPGEERLIMMIATPPEDAQAGQGGTVIVKQYLEILDVDELMHIGDITYPITVDLFQPEAIADLEAFKNGNINTLQWTPITHDVAGNEDNIACYNVYKGDTPDFEPEPDNRVGRVAVDQNDDEPGFQWCENLPTKANIFYIVRVEDEAGYESENSNVAAIFDFVMDWGDAPDPTYPTLAANSGAFHLMDGATYLGLSIDPEFDGQPNAFATGDDLNNLDDEDGVTFLWPLRAGNPCKIKVTATGNNALFSGWIDFNANGSWADPEDHVFADINLIAGDNFLTFIAPANAAPGNTYARFRYSHQANLSFIGEAQDGEVEDYIVEVDDYGDLKWIQPPDLPGLHANDQVHIADDWICGGGQVTAVRWWGNYEQVNQGINHFILNIYDDMDCMPGTELASYMVPFAQANETNTGNLIGGLALYAYDYMLPAPFDQTEGQTYWLSVISISNNQDNPAIWRWCESSRWFWPINCGAVDWMYDAKGWRTIFWTFPEPGKFSDMAFMISSEEPPPPNIDFGDAPDDPYPTLLSSDGARHLSDGVFYLGTKIDTEPDGQPTVAADGDDLNNMDDEDGVVFRTPFVAGEDATIKVLASEDGFLNVWLDIDRNGSWADATDHVFVDELLVKGWNTLYLPIPDDAKQGNTYIRFRFDSQGGLNYYGLAENGEVEDYLVKVYPENWGFIPTPVTHTILVPLNVALNGLTLSANDAIGVFFNDNGVEVCGGAAIWDGTSNQVVLAYGDDNTTPAVKDGFADGETLTWRVYHAGTGVEEVVSVQYNAAMPQSDGTFLSYGLSGLTQINGLSVTATANPTSLCQGDDVQLDVIITGGSGSYTYSWTSTPAGFTSNVKNPSDMPDQDITYHVTVTDGGASASSSVDVAVQLEPVAVIGADATICDTDTYDLNGTASNQSAVLWTTAGNGTFSIPNINNPTYYPGNLDISNGSVVLTFTAYPINPCTAQVSASLTLTIQPSPVASAGADGTICAGEDFVLLGSEANASSVLWETDGDGTFDNSGNLSPTYYPGTTDISSGQVDICLTAFPEVPCLVAYEDCVSLTILESQTVHLHEGWNGLSSYLTPYNAYDNNLLFDPVIGNLIVAYNFGGAFWPGGSTNTLNWTDHNGYVAKMSADDDMLFCGDRVSNLVINLNQNWNIVPVLSDHDVDVTSVFDNQVDFKMVMEVAHYNMYWPAYGINTLGNMESGKAYFAFMDTADAIDFGNASPKASPIVPQELVNTSPWNDVASSPAGHAIAFSANACSEFKPGDMVGAFTSTGLCAGMINVESQAIGLRVNGDDPYTAQFDGFANDEPMTYRLYRPESSEQFKLSVVYDDKLDHSGLYHDFAMSAIVDVKMAPTSVQSLAGADIRIYPNPSHGVFNVDGISSETEIMVYDAFGSLIYSKTTHQPIVINLSAQPAGIYLIQIQTLNGTHYQKIIIN